MKNNKVKLKLNEDKTITLEDKSLVKLFGLSFWPVLGVYLGMKVFNFVAVKLGETTSKLIKELKK